MVGVPTQTQAQKIMTQLKNNLETTTKNQNTITAARMAIKTNPDANTATNNTQANTTYQGIKTNPIKNVIQAAAANTQKIPSFVGVPQVSDFDKKQLKANTSNSNTPTNPSTTTTPTTTVSKTTPTTSGSTDSKKMRGVVYAAPAKVTAKPIVKVQPKAQLFAGAKLTALGDKNANTKDATPTTTNTTKVTNTVSSNTPISTTKFSDNLKSTATPQLSPQVNNSIVLSTQKSLPYALGKVNDKTPLTKPISSVIRPDKTEAKPQLSSPNNSILTSSSNTVLSSAKMSAAAPSKNNPLQIAKATLGDFLGRKR